MPVIFAPNKPTRTNCKCTSYFNRLYFAVHKQKYVTFRMTICDCTGVCYDYNPRDQVIFHMNK